MGYQAAPDGQRFLVNFIGTTDAASLPVTIVMGWQALLKK